jgi:RNAse (barnase) inhibitor barstar
MIPFHFQEPPAARPDQREIHVPAGIETKPALFDVLARGFSLPDYFGRNWDALEECLRDLNWLEEKEIILVHRDIPLAKTAADARIYLQILSGAAHEPKRLLVFFPESSRSEIIALLAGPKN